MNQKHEYPGSLMPPYSALIDIPWRQTRMLHHISLPVRDLAHSGAFYDAALGALGYRRVFEDMALNYGNSGNR